MTRETPEGPTEQGAVIDDPRIEDRRRRIIQLKRRRILVLTAGAALLVALGITLYRVVFDSSLFAISKVVISDSGGGVPVGFVEKVAGSYRGENLFRIDTAAVARRLLVNPVVGTAVVKVAIPHSLEVIVTKAVPLFMIQSVAGSRSPVALNSRFEVMPASTSLAGAVVVCFDPRTFSGSSTSVSCANAAPAAQILPLLPRALEIVKQLGSYHLATVKVYVFSTFGLGIALSNGWFVYFASSTNVSPAVAALHQLAQRQVLASGSVIDLSVANHPTVNNS